MRIHILGASGSGTSTLGRALASTLGAPFFDADDFYWERTDPPYQTPRPIAARTAAIEAAVAGLPSWIISGSMMGWGDVLIPRLDLAVYLSIPQELRLTRLRAREQAHFGERLLPGGDMHAEHQTFMTWAAGYEAGGLEMRSQASHARWLELLDCRLLRIDGDVSTDERVRRVREALAQPAAPRSASPRARVRQGDWPSE